MSLFGGPNDPYNQRPHNYGVDWGRWVPNSEHFPGWAKATVVTVCVVTALIFFGLTERRIDRLRLEVLDVRAEIRGIRTEVLDVREAAAASLRAERAERISERAEIGKQLTTLRKNQAWDILDIDKDLRAAGLRDRSTPMPVSTGDISPPEGD